MRFWSRNRYESINWPESLRKAELSFTCRRHVADMSPTRVNVSKSWPTLRVVATQKSPRHTQFISITTNKYKSAQTYGYLSRVFVFELKQQSRNYRHVGNSRHVVSFWTPWPTRHLVVSATWPKRVATCRRHDTECRRLGNKIDTPTSDMWS